jgi:hypothetical protein
MTIAHTTPASLDRSQLFNARIENKPFSCIFSFLHFSDVDAVKHVGKDWNKQSRKWQQLYLEEPIRSLANRNNFSGCAFLTTNESDVETTFESLEKIEKIARGVHIGVSGLHNWDYIAAMGSSFAILIDHSTNSCLFNSKALEILRSSPTRLVFKQKLLKELATASYEISYNFLYEDTSRLENHSREILGWIGKSYSALHNDMRFNFLKKLALDNRILVVRLSLLDCDKIEQISRILHRIGLKVSSLYLSNIYDYYCKDELSDGSPEQQSAFKKSISLLKDDDTCIIDSSAYLAPTTHALQQRVSLGKNFVPAKEREEAFKPECLTSSASIP